MVYVECSINAGLDLRRLTKGDPLWQIIANKELIAINQDPLGIQAKRIYCSIEKQNPDTVYVTDNNRVDILAKPLANGDIALSFINLSDTKNTTEQAVDVERILNYIGHKMVDAATFANAGSYSITDLWTGSLSINTSGVFAVTEP